MADIPRIKSNISKMIAQNAPEADIDAYVASEGVTLDQLKGNAAPDKYKQAAIDDRTKMKAAGVDPAAGLTRLGLQGATFNLADEAIAGLSTPLEMIKRGTFDPREGYKYAKASEDLNLEEGRKAAGMGAPAAEILGGIFSGAGLASRGISFARGLGSNAGLGARSLASAGDGVAMGALAGVGEGNGLTERLGNGLLGGAIGGAVGGAAPSVVAIGKQAISPILSNIRARVNPEGFAQTQVARGVTESGQTPQQLADAVARANAEGQGMFTLADAMGNSGQRMLSSTARAPGRARTDVVEFLDQRQAGQGRRVANSLAEGFDAPQTAEQLRTGMTAARDTAADAAYGSVRTNAGRTDVVPALNNLDRNIGTMPGQQVTAANDSVEAVLTPFRQRLARVDPNDFEAVQRIRFDMADAAQNARQSGYGNRARLITQAVRELDASMEGASQGYQQANRNFAQASRDIDAIDLGRDAAMRGRTEDIIPQFQGLTPQGQRAFRTGYSDPLIGQAQGSAFGANKARPLINDAFADESRAMAPGADLMHRRIGRENTMFQTRNAAVGNSKTAENLADDAAMGVDPTLVGQLLSGNWGGALRSTLAAGQNMMSGNTAAVREEVARLLLQRGQNVNPAQIQRMLDETMRRLEVVRQIARTIGGGARGGLAVAPSAIGNAMGQK
jgi:hypothetical protein